MNDSYPKHKHRPLRTTVFWGIFWGILFIVPGLFFENTILWPIFFRAMITLCLTLYALCLAAWTEKKRVSVMIPLIFLFIFASFQNSTAIFLLFCLGLLSWIRSGICFQNAFAKSLIAEILFSMGGGALVALFHPNSALNWGLGIWMFFLVQSLYFLFMTNSIATSENFNPDTFEQARRRAESILGAGTRHNIY